MQKLRQYCAYQERSHTEVVQKLWDLGVWRSEHDAIIAALIEDDYLNEERFAVQFAGGKFRMKGWGRKKILYALKEKGVSTYNINKALKEITPEAYEKTIVHAAEKKWAELKGEQHLIRKKKCTDYLLQKGFEPELISKTLATLTNNKY